MAHPKRSLVISCLLLALAACGGSESTASGTPPAASAAPAPASVTTAPYEATTKLHGSWRVHLTQDQLSTALAAAGFGEYADVFMREQEVEADGISQVLTVRADRFSFAYQSGDQPWHVGWKGTASIEGDTVALKENDTVDRFRWTADGDVLSFELVQMTPGINQGVPNEAYAVYLTTAPWERVDCMPLDPGCTY